MVFGICKHLLTMKFVLTYNYPIELMCGYALLSKRSLISRTIMTPVVNTHNGYKSV